MYGTDSWACSYWSCAKVDDYLWQFIDDMLCLPLRKTYAFITRIFCMSISYSILGPML